MTASSAPSASVAARTVTVCAVLQFEPVKTSVFWSPGEFESVSTARAVPPPVMVKVTAPLGRLVSAAS